MDYTKLTDDELREGLRVIAARLVEMQFQLDQYNSVEKSHERNELQPSGFRAKAKRHIRNYQAQQLLINGELKKRIKDRNAEQEIRFERRFISEARLRLPETVFNQLCEAARGS